MHTIAPATKRNQPSAIESPASVTKPGATPVTAPSLQNLPPNPPPDGANKSRFTRLLNAMAYWAQSRS